MKKEEYIRRYGIEKYNSMREKDKERLHKRWLEHKEELKEYKKEYYKKNKDRLNQISKEWRENNKEYMKEYHKKHYQDNKESYKDNAQRCSKTLPGRANRLLQGYKWADIRDNREGFDLTSEWVIDNILTKACIYCGETDWTKLGCDRIDNEKAHSMENCVCSCRICNQQRYYEKMSVEEFILHRKHHRSELLS